MLGKARLGEDDSAGTWQGINSPRRAWGRGLCTGTCDMPRKGVSDPLPSSSAKTHLRAAGMQRGQRVFCGGSQESRVVTHVLTDRDLTTPRQGVLPRC